MNMNKIIVDEVVVFVMDVCDGSYDEDAIDEFVEDKFGIKMTDELLTDIDLELDDYFQYQYQ